MAEAAQPWLPSWMRLQRWAVVATVALLSLWVAHNSAEEESLVHQTATVVVTRVVDGDTFHARIVASSPTSGSARAVGALVREWRDESRTVRIRLHGIDAPERGQPFCDEAREELRRLLVNSTRAREVICHILERDVWGRYVAQVVTRNSLYTARTNVNREMVAGGFAWVYGGLRGDSPLDALMTQARTHRRGLWADSRPIAPWVYREQFSRIFHSADTRGSVGWKWYRRREQAVQRQRPRESPGSDNPWQLRGAVNATRRPRGRRAGAAASRARGD